MNAQQEPEQLCPDDEHAQIAMINHRMPAENQPWRKNRLNIVKCSDPQGTGAHPRSTFRERKLAHLVGRLHEMCRLEDLRMQHSGKYRDLNNKVTRSFTLPPGTTMDKLAWADAQLKQHRRDQDAYGISQWKCRLRDSPSACFAWLADSQVVPKPNVFSEQVPHLGTSECVEDALVILREHWRTVWDRQDDWREAWNHLEPHILRRPPVEISVMAANHIHKAAAKMRGRSAGPDGWSGSEIADLPLCIFEDVSKMFQLFETAGITPTCWKLAKQVHLPKQTAPGARASGAVSASKLRPVTVLSTWYRLWARSRLTTHEIKTWVQAWWPEDAVGGKVGGEVFDCLADIDEACQQDQFLASLDFSLAFDHVHPRLVKNAFRALGLPDGVASMIGSVWEQQMRVLVYDRIAFLEAQLVSTSTPQGDAWSMYGLVAILGPVTADINRKVPGIGQKLFVDDRCLYAPAAADVIAAAREWEVWSNQLGLKENRAKAVFFHKTPRGRRELQAGGVPEGQISSHPKILGAELQGSQRRSSTPAEKARLDDANRIIRRCKYLPVSWGQKKRVLATQALAKAAWGWIFRLPTQGEMRRVQTQIACAVKEIQHACVNLRSLLTGHTLHLAFRITSMNVGAAFRQASKRRGGVPCMWSRQGWSAVLDKALQSWGWENRGPWLWWHPDIGKHLSLSRARHWREWSVIAHDLRESFRRSLFSNFLQADRRDLEDCPAAYDPEVVKRTRQAAAVTRENFQILCGATMSPAAYRSAKNLPMYGCPACGDDQVVPTLEHLVQQCRAFDRGLLPVLEPLEARLGWPVYTGARAHRVLEIHRKVRRWILADRYD